MKKIVTRTAEIVLGDDGIIRKKILDDVDIEEADIIENQQAVLALTGNAPYVIVTDGREANVRISHEARQYVAGPVVSQYRIAEALLIDSMASRITANFYLRVNKPISPTRLFTDEQKALEWLRTFLPIQHSK